MTLQSELMQQKPSLTVKVSRMSESNGRVWWTVWLAHQDDAKPWDGYQVYSDDIEGRAQYEAACLRHFLGQGPVPDILAFDTDATDAPAATRNKTWLLEMAAAVADKYASGGAGSDFELGMIHAAQAIGEEIRSLKQNSEPITDQQIDDAAAKLGISDLRPLGQQWDMVCQLIRDFNATESARQSNTEQKGTTHE